MNMFVIYFLPRFQKSSCSDGILSDSEVLRTPPVPGWVTGHGETGPSDHPHPLIMEADGGAGQDSCPLLQQDWCFAISLCPLAPQFESINSLALSLLYGPTLTSVHDWTRG